jgi:hypothetical protein
MEFPMPGISLEELAELPLLSDAPLRIQNDAWYDGTRFLSEFAQTVSNPVLNSLLDPSSTERAAITIYFRMGLILEAIVALKNIRYFQTVAASTRSLFEHWLDLELIVGDTTDRNAQKFFEFPEAQKFWTAKRLVEFAETSPDSVKRDIAAQRAFISNEARQKKFAKRTHDHWSGKNVRERAKSIGRESMYLEIYSMLSWFTHSDPTGTEGLRKEAFERLFGFSHSLIQRIFINATISIAHLTKMSSLDEFEGWVRSLRLKTAELITVEQIEAYKARKK